MIFYVAIFGVLLVLYIYQVLGRKRRIPPGLKEIPIEKGLPIIGVMNKIEKPLCNFFTKLGQKHGPIYQIKLGMRNIVVLNSFDFVKAALVDNGKEFSGRWKSHDFLFVCNNSGLIFIDGNKWAQQRAFVIKNLKDFGMGRPRAIEIVQEECVYLLQEIENLKGRGVEFAPFISIYTANVICKFIMNKGFKHGDPDFQVMEKYLEITTTSNDPFSNLCLMFPFFENNEWLVKIITWMSERKSVADACHSFFEKEMKMHLEKLDFASEGEDLMDRFLIIQYQLNQTNGDVESFTNMQSIRNALELLGAGYDTSTALLVWALMFMSKYPEIQCKVHQEIIGNVGDGRLPTMGDKVSLNYTQAVMDEILRLSTISPLSIFHRTLADVNVKGYFIPKDTVVITNLFACHIDTNVWEKPFQFYPEHFLFTDPNGNVKYKAREELIPFGMGKRQCLGESLARSEYFIFFTGIIQRFQVSFNKETSEKVDFDVFHANPGLIRSTGESNFIFKKRGRGINTGASV